MYTDNHTRHGQSRGRTKSQIVYQKEIFFLHVRNDHNKYA